VRTLSSLISTRPHPASQLTLEAEHPVPKPAIQDILETCLYVTDLEAAERFYTDILDLTFVSKIDGRHVFLRCGKRMLLLFNAAVTAEVREGLDIAPPHGAIGPGHVAFSIGADDFDMWRDHLTANHVEIEKEIQWDDRGCSLYFRDPSGNSLEVTTPSIWGIDRA
jgi:catechol 2,3-dioxygenase-like lactoylglutathione lyase family enzyme